MFDKLAEELKQARESSGMTLQQLANKSRIDMKFLEAIEDGNFAFLPELYVKAFLKEFARFTGLDEKVIIKKYESIKAGKSPDEVIAPPPAAAGEEPKREEAKPVVRRVTPVRTYTPEPEINEGRGQNKNSNVLIYGIAAGVLVIIAIVYFVFIKSSNDSIIVEKSYDQVLEENQPRYETNAPAQNNGAAGNTQNGDSLRLEISTSDTSWVKIIIDNKTAEDFILFPGSQKIIAASNNFKVTFGNARGIRLLLNNKPLSFTGKGKVSHISVDTTGIKYLDSPPSL